MHVRRKFYNNEDEIKHKNLIAQYQAIRAESMRMNEISQRKERMESLMFKVPPRFREKRFEDFKIDYPAQSIVKKTAQKFVNTYEDRLKEGTCLFFHGKPGTGKTFLSLIIYQELVLKGQIVTYENSLQFLKNIQEKRFESNAAFNFILNSYRHSPLLIIDEITEGCGKDGYLAEWERSNLFSVIDARYQEQRSTIVISNRNQSDFVDRLGMPIVNRLNENGVMIGFEWESYRTTKNNQVMK